MTANTQLLDVSALERLIYQVRGIQAARVVVDQGGRIDEVHVVGVPGRSPKQIVRDIESILYVRGGVRVDHRKVSLVQIAEEVVHPTPSRVRLHEVVFNETDTGQQVQVTLQLGDMQIQGVGSSRPDRPADLPLLAAYAAIHALDQLVGAHGQLHLEHLQMQQLGSLTVYIVHLTLSADGGMDVLLGISVVREDTLYAVVRAVLDAVNRRVQQLSRYF